MWEGDDRPQPLLPGSRRDSPAGGGSGGGDAPRTPGSDGSGFGTVDSDAGSDAPATPASRGSLTASDRAHTGERRASRLRREHNGSLSGEVQARATRQPGRADRLRPRHRPAQEAELGTTCFAPSKEIAHIQTTADFCQGSIADTRGVFTAHSARIDAVRMPTSSLFTSNMLSLFKAPAMLNSQSSWGWRT